MHIDSYNFGKMTIDGVEYHKDLVAYADRVFADWWREEGHRLCPEDIDELLQYHPDLLVIGTGASGIMEVPKVTGQYIEHKAGQQEALPYLMLINYANGSGESSAPKVLISILTEPYS